MILKNFLEDREKNNGKILVKVKSWAKENKILEKMLDGTWKIAVNAVRENGRANKELIKFLSKITECKKDEITIISWQTQEYKIIEWKK